MIEVVNGSLQLNVAGYIPPLMRTVNGVTYRVSRYRPRIEGLFARIERWILEGAKFGEWVGMGAKPGGAK